MVDAEPIEFHAIAVEAALLLSMANDQTQYSSPDLDHLRASLEALLETDELRIAVESLVRLAAHLHTRGAGEAAGALLEVAAMAAPALAREHEARADADRHHQERFRSFNGDRRGRASLPSLRPTGGIALRDLVPRKTIR